MISNVKRGPVDGHTGIGCSRVSSSRATKLFGNDFGLFGRHPSFCLFSILRPVRSQNTLDCLLLGHITVLNTPSKLCHYDSFKDRLPCLSHLLELALLPVDFASARSGKQRNLRYIVQRYVRIDLINRLKRSRLGIKCNGSAPETEITEPETL